jgi:hypothetical protein
MLRYDAISLLGIKVTWDQLYDVMHGIMSSKKLSGHTPSLPHRSIYFQSFVIFGFFTLIFFNQLEIDQIKINRI